MTRAALAWAIVLLTVICGCAGGTHDYAVYRCIKAADPIRLDGVLDEQSWQRANSAPVRYAVSGGQEARSPAGHLRMCWDNRALHVAVEVPDKNLQASGRGRDSVSLALPNDGVELLLDVAGDDALIFRFRLNPLGGLTDELLVRASPGSGLERRTRHRTLALPCYSVEGARCTAKASGDIGHPEIVDDRWIVELSVPHRGLLLPYERHSGRRAPHPKAGDAWRLQVMVQNCDLPERQHTWSPAPHFPPRSATEFGRLEFVAHGAAPRKGPES
jgi:hypothetical protein